MKTTKTLSGIRRFKSSAVVTAALSILLAASACRKDDPPYVSPL